MNKHICQQSFEVHISWFIIYKPRKFQEPETVISLDDNIILSSVTVIFFTYKVILINVFLYHRLSEPDTGY